MNKEIKTHILSPGVISVVLIVALLAIDQAIKIMVKTHMCLGEAIHVTDWFYIDFVENNGMAYGMTFINKLVLSLLRIVAILFIGWYIRKQVQRKVRMRYIVLLSMVFAGAAGNIFDSMFYGLVFDASTPFDVATVVPFGTGYAHFLMGKVVDMFYFPLIVTTWPSWVPWVGGSEFVFFSPVFNFADSCISVGVVLLLIMCRRELETLHLFSSSEKQDSGDTDNKDRNE